jgi:3,4-dihydroxy 2-butanone 4-phosphate synthase / GTP cyclohydrolase II
MQTNEAIGISHIIHLFIASLLASFYFYHLPPLSLYLFPSLYTLTYSLSHFYRCDCKEQLHMALAQIQKHGGCIIYLQQEGRGIGLANKIAAYALQDAGLDTVDANLHLGFPEDSREYGVVPSILQDMGIGSIQLMTNNPRKVDLLKSLGVVVDRTLPVVVPKTNPHNIRYMETKLARMNHDNLAVLLSQEPNSVMLPRKSLADQYINNGTEMTANAVQVSLMVEDEVDSSDDEAAGVTASEDGYCFGKQSVLDGIAAVARGEMIVVVDDMDRENEGDFIMAADQCTDMDMARIVRYSSGVICVAMEEDRMDLLKLPPMVENNEDPKGTAFTVTIDATKEHGITTGISASDRAKTIQLMANLNAKATDFNRPGHIFPLRSRYGGVLTRDGHTEAAVDFSRLAGRGKVGVLCEIVSEENPTEMMRLPEIKRFCKRHGFVLTSIVDLAQYRRETGL